MRPLIALAIVAGFVAASVGLARVAPSANGPVTLGGGVYHDVGSPDEYFRVLPKPLQILLETEGIPHFDGAAGATTRNLVVTEDTYLDALARVRRGGLLALTEAERVTLLFVSLAALAAQQETAKYRVVALDSSTGREVGHVVTQERYRFDTLEGWRFPSLTARSSIGEGVVWAFGADPHLAVDAPEETIDSYEFTDVGTDNERVMRIGCARTRQLWERFQGDFTEQYGSSWLLPILPNIRFSLSAEPSGHAELIEGRPAYKLVWQEQSGPRSWDEHRAWLGSDSLWPLQWEYDLDSDTARSLHWDFEGRGYTVRVTLEDVNGELDIVAPKANLSCMEQYASGSQ